MPMYRKKPVVIEAWQWNFSGDQEEQPFWLTDALIKWPAVGGAAFEPDHADGPRICIATLEGVHNARPGDFIIKGVHGEIYPCKPDIFAKTYEVAHTKIAAETFTDEEADETGLSLFAEAMREKLAKKRGQGRGGWFRYNECDDQKLEDQLSDHYDEDDWVDVANYAMMLWNRRNTVIDDGFDTTDLGA